jgi:D123
MPAVEDESPQKLTKLPFPPVTKQHIMNCSYSSWQPKFRSSTPKARVIPLTPAFVEYLNADGIVLPDDYALNPPNPDKDSGVFSEDQDGEDSDDEEMLVSSIISLLWITLANHLLSGPVHSLLGHPHKNKGSNSRTRRKSST